MGKKLLLLIIGILLITGHAWSAINTPTNMRVTVLSTVDSMTVTYTPNHSSSCDSTRILNAADSTLVKKFTATEDSTIAVASLTQGTAYHWIVLVDSADVQSAPDSISFTTADIAQPAFTMDSSTSTTITVTVVTSPAGGDSLIVVTGPDSVAVVWSTTTGIDTTGFTVTGLTPFTQYIWRLKADSANAVRSSALDTLNTKLALEDQVNPGLTNRLRSGAGRVWKHPVLRSDSWRGTLYTTFTLDGADAAVTDSSLILNAAEYTSLFGTASGVADSTAFTILVYSGEFLEGKDDLVHYEVLVDSINVTGSGTFGGTNASEASNLNLPVSEHYMLKFRNDTAQSVAGTVVKLWQYRYKD